MTHVLRFVERLELRDDLVVTIPVTVLTTSTVITGGGLGGVSTMAASLVRRLSDGAVLWVASSLVVELQP